MTTTASRFFYSYGKLCSYHPWEVIIASITISISLKTLIPSTSCAKEFSRSFIGIGSGQMKVRKAEDDTTVTINHAKQYKDAVLKL